MSDPVQPFCPGYRGEPSASFDSDGDGYTDAAEFHNTPGSDPCDASDTQANPRDSDNDGCSDFDERTFNGFCDENPFTPVSYPRPVFIQSDPCDLLCIQVIEGGSIFCDSDCDGWFDDVELGGGYDPCNPFSPPFVPSPSARAPVCDVLDALLNGKTRITSTDLNLAFAEQVNQILNRR